MQEVLEKIWLGATLAVVALALIGGIFGLFTIPWFLTTFWVIVAISIALGFITGNLEIGWLSFRIRLWGK